MTLNAAKRIEMHNYLSSATAADSLKELLSFLPACRIRVHIVLGQNTTIGA